MGLRFTGPIEMVDPREEEFRAVLESDLAFDEFTVKWCSYRYGTPIAVRAKTYDEVHPCQDIYTHGYQWWPWWCKDPRRPVAMRGSLRVLIEKYSWTAPHIANGWATRVAVRYLRRICYTCRDREQHGALMDRIWSSLNDKFHLSHVFSLDGEGFYVGPLLRESPNMWVGHWINGKHEVRHLEETAPTPKPVKSYEGRVWAAASTPIRTRRPDERAILRAVYELGLIKEGDAL